MLLDLDTSLLEYCCSYCNLTEIGRLLQCNNKQLYHNILNWNTVWKSFCQQYYCLDSTTTPTHNITDTHQHYYNLFIQYVNEYSVNSLHNYAYKRVHTFWQQYTQYTNSNIPSITESLQPGATATDIDQFNSTVYRKLLFELPIEYVLFLRHHNGQQLYRPTRRPPIYRFHGMYGIVKFYDIYAELYSVDIETGITELNLDYGVLIGATERTIQNPEPSPNPADQIRLYINPHGQIIRRTNTTNGVHIIANTFIEFIEKYMSDLQNGVMQVYSSNKGINRFPFKDSCGSTSITHSIQITVSVLYVPEFSSTRQYFFTYQIHIIHTGDTDTNYTLTRRKWIVTNIDGSNERVTEGDGVIGLYPNIYRDCTPFTYESCSPINQPQGSMRGAFYWTDNKNGVEIETPINPFTFDTNKNYT